MAILGEGPGRVAMLVQLNTPTVEFDLVQSLLAARWRGAQRRRGWWQVTRKHMITRAKRVGLCGRALAIELWRLEIKDKRRTA
jgi:hypothetical protein